MRLKHQCSGMYTSASITQSPIVASMFDVRRPGVSHYAQRNTLNDIQAGGKIFGMSRAPEALIKESSSSASAGVHTGT